MPHAVGKDVIPAPSGQGSITSGRVHSTVASGSGTDRPSLNSAFVLPPSEEEVEAALFVLKKIFLSGALVNAVQDDFSHLGKETGVNVPVSAEESDSHQANLHFEKALQLNSLEKLPYQGQHNILNLFNLLRSNPSLQRIVVSLAADKRIWEAMMKNEAVNEFKQSFLTGNQRIEGGSRYEFLISGAGDIVAIIVEWVLENLRTKVMGLIDKIIQLVNELFHTVVEKERSLDVLDDIMRSLFMLALMTSIVVVIIRFRKINVH